MTGYLISISTFSLTAWLAWVVASLAHEASHALAAWWFEMNIRFAALGKVPQSGRLRAFSLLPDAFGRRFRLYPYLLGGAVEVFGERWKKSRPRVPAGRYLAFELYSPSKKLAYYLAGSALPGAASVLIIITIVHALPDQLFGALKYFKAVLGGHNVDILPPKAAFVLLCAFVSIVTGIDNLIPRKTEVNVAWSRKPRSFVTDGYEIRRYWLERRLHRAPLEWEIDNFGKITRFCIGLRSIILAAIFATLLGWGYSVSLF